MNRDLIGYGPTPPAELWPNGQRLAVQVVVAYEEGAEHTLAESQRREVVSEYPSSVPPNIRDVNTESVFEYGSRVGIWRLLRLLRESGTHATFMVCGKALERNPPVAEAIRSGGHEFCGHGYRWLEYGDLSVEAQTEDIRACVAAIQKVAGVSTLGWFSRSPSPRTREILATEPGFIYDSQAFNDDIPYYVAVEGRDEPWLVVPYSLELNDMKFWRREMGLRDFEDYLINAFDCLYEEGAEHPRMMSIGLHARVLGTPGRANILRRFLDHAAKPGVWFARRDEIAKWWLAKHPPH